MYVKPADQRQGTSKDLLMRLAALLVLIAFMNGGLVTQSIGQTPSIPRMDKQRIDKLIESLCSQHPAPSPKTRVPMREERSVWKAVDELMSLGPRAFPQLIEHFDDDRYSYTEDNVSGARQDGPSVNQSVGRLCYRIVTAQVQKYVSWEGPDTPDPRRIPGYSSTAVPFDKENALKWIKDRVDSPLWELQKENLLLVVKQNEDLLTTIEKDSYHEQLCRTAIKRNSELIARLERTKKPLPSTSPRPWFER